MDPGGRRDKLGSKELVERISGSLLTLFDTLSMTNRDITFYFFRHAVEEIRRDPDAWTRLDEAYTIYEEQANNCRRLWMKIRSTAEKEMSHVKTTGGTSALPEPRSRGRSPSSLEYQSEPGEGDMTLTLTGRVDQVAPIDIDLAGVERDHQRPPTPVVDPPPPRPKRKESDALVPRRTIVTPSGATACRLAPIPRGANLSQHSFSSLQFISQGTGSSSQASLSTAPTDFSSAMEYWKPRRPLQPSDFQMDENRLFGGLDCLGPPFHVKMEEITHTTIPAMCSDLCGIYGGKLGLTPKISSQKLKVHGFDHWMTPNAEFYPCLPAQPGWPGFMLRMGNGCEEWRPEEGTDFRVVIRKDSRFLEYIGQYEMVRLGDITGDEWKRQPAKVRKRWANIVGGGQSWYDAVARVALRKRLGREPSVPEFEKFTDKLSNKSYTTLAKELEGEIDQAFCNEEEVIAVWGMKCVGYDYKFEKHLARSFKKIKPSSSGSPKKKKTITKDNNIKDKEGGRDDDPEPHDSRPTKRQRVAKGKAKATVYDWSDAKYHDDNRDEDYKPTAG